MTTANKSLWLVSEGSNYATDPGSGYLAVPAESIGELDARVTPLVSRYQTGRGLPTAAIPGPMAWSLDFQIPIEGLSDSAGDGDSPPTSDYADVLWAHIAGNSESRDGEGFASVTDADTIVLDSDIADVQQLLPLYESGVPAVERTHWALVTNDAGAGTYDVAPGNPDHGTAPFTGSAVAYGIRGYYQTQAGQGGNSIMLILDDDGQEYELLGGRVTSATIEGNVGEKAMLSVTVQGDRWATSSNGLTPTTGPATNPCVMTISPVFFNGTEIETRRVSIDLGISASPRASTAALHGRADFTNQGLEPSAEVSTLRTDNTYRAIQQAQTTGRLMVQFGGGAGETNSALGTCAFHAEHAQLEETQGEDDEGRARQVLRFKVVNNGFFSGTTVARYWQFARA